MNLYWVKYRTWNNFFSGLDDVETLSVGNNEKEAIARVKNIDRDGRDFVVTKIDKIFGYKILVHAKEE